MDAIDDLGWIKLHRKILDNPIFRDPETLQLFIYLLLRANHKEGHRFIFNGQEIYLERGQCLTGLDRISGDTGLSFWKIRARLDLLETLKIITRKTTNRFSIVSICNYSLYQDSPEGKPQAKPQTNHKQTTTFKNLRIKEFKNLKCNDFESLSTFLSSLPEYIDFTPEARELIAEFLNHTRASNSTKIIQGGRVSDLVSRLKGIQDRTDPESLVQGLKAVLKKTKEDGFDFKRRDPTAYVLTVAKSKMAESEKNKLEKSVSEERTALRNANEGAAFQRLKVTMGM